MSTYIDNVKTEVKDYFNHLSGSAYVRMLDTPGVWGQPFGNEIMPTALDRQVQFERAIVEIIQKTKYRCDLSSLNSPDPDWVRAILGAMDTCLTKTMGRTQPTQFRFLFGQTPLYALSDPPNFIDFKAALVRLFRERSSHWEILPEIWMGRFYRLDTNILTKLQASFFGPPAIGSTDTTMTWNHTKIISMDGTEALVGGHNLNMDLFRSYPPVHDASVVVHGEASYGVQLFLNQMWSCGKDLLVKESLNTTSLSWTNESDNASVPSDPLTGSGVVTYMKAQQDAIIKLHQSGKQTGTDNDNPASSPALASGMKAQDLQTLSDLDLEVFQERITYNTYENFDDYKLASRLLTVGKYWDGPSKSTNFQMASELMKKYLISNAKRSIKMSQMDIISAWKKNWSDHHVAIWLLEALLANEDLQVQIVVSPLNAGAGAEGDQYSFGSGASRTFELLEYYMNHKVDTDEEIPDPDGKRAYALSRVQVAPFYFTNKVPAASRKEGSTYFWPNLTEEGYTRTLKQRPLSEKPPSKGIIGSAAMSAISAKWGKPVPSAPGNHSKIMIIDDEVYVVGSDNLYPGYLSEVNYLVEGIEAVDELIASYWTPLWRYSGPSALSGIDIDSYKTEAVAFLMAIQRDKRLNAIWQKTVAERKSGQPDSSASQDVKEAYQAETNEFLTYIIRDGGFQTNALYVAAALKLDFFKNNEGAPNDASDKFIKDLSTDQSLLGDFVKIITADYDTTSQANGALTTWLKSKGYDCTASQVFASYNKLRDQRLQFWTGFYNTGGYILEDGGHYFDQFKNNTSNALVAAESNPTNDSSTHQKAPSLTVYTNTETGDGKPVPAAALGQILIIKPKFQNGVLSWDTKSSGFEKNNTSGSLTFSEITRPRHGDNFVGRECYGTITFPDSGTAPQKGTVSYYNRWTQKQAPDTPPSVPPDSVKKHGNYTGIIIGVVAGVAVIGGIGLAIKKFRGRSRELTEYEKMKKDLPNNYQEEEMQPLNSSRSSSELSLESDLSGGFIDQPTFDFLKQQNDNEVDQYDDDVSTSSDETDSSLTNEDDGLLPETPEW